MCGSVKTCMEDVCKVLVHPETERIHTLQG